MPWLSEFKRRLQRSGPKEQRPDGWPVTGLAAFYGRQAPTTPAAIQYLSSGGVYLDIQEPLPAGEIVTLTLQMEGGGELSSELKITLQAQVAGKDEFGVKLSFLLPPGLDAGLWEVLVRDVALLTNRDQAVEVFRTLRTVLFLCRLCGAGAEEAILLLGGHLDQDRTTALFKIAFAAEDLLIAGPDGGRMRAHPKLMANLLRDGSWAPDELITQLWVGLLVSSCSMDEPDDSNQIFVDLLVHITPQEARILTHACERALSSAPANGDFSPVSVVLGPHEIVQLTGMYDLTRNATDLAYLFNLGLIQNVFDFTSYRDFDRFDITPTRLALELYGHCHGRCGKIDPELVAAAREHLAFFFPPPLPSALGDVVPVAPNLPQEK